MLPRRYRLARRHDFARVYSRGKQYRSPLISLYALGRGRPEPRFGISVSKKVGGAVARNLVKRRLRECCRRVLRSTPLMDFVLVARQPALEVSFETLTVTVEQLVGRAAQERSDRSQGVPGRTGGSATSELSGGASGTRGRGRPWQKPTP